MASFTLGEMLEMQATLQEKYKDRWEAIGPETGQNKMLWMIGEIGEVIDIIKKHGADTAISTPELRVHLTEELADVLMYFGDILLCYGISEDELGESYRKKFKKNMTRW